MQRAGVSQWEVARRLNVHYCTVNRLLRRFLSEGVNKWSSKTWLPVCDNNTSTTYTNVNCKNISRELAKFRIFILEQFIEYWNTMWSSANNLTKAHALCLIADVTDYNGEAKSDQRQNWTQVVFCYESRFNVSNAADRCRDFHSLHNLCVSLNAIVLDGMAALSRVQLPTSFGHNRSFWTEPSLSCGARTKCIQPV